MLNRLRIPSLAAAVVFATGMVHNHLVKSSPSDGERLPAAPQEVRLWFNERPEIPFTSVTLMQGDSTKIATIKAVATGDSMVVAIPLATALAPGKYLVAWRTASSDGHAIRGVFGFSIAP
ncbi:MAG TPA: copper resistance CopC family protein [Gemmatimonadales bacterium]|jgi:methionine-rich copper-binding protein CopC